MSNGKWEDFCCICQTGGQTIHEAVKSVQCITFAATNTENQVNQGNHSLTV
jgi:hypothetical protein